MSLELTRAKQSVIERCSYNGGVYGVEVEVIFLLSQGPSEQCSVSVKERSVNYGAWRKSNKLSRLTVYGSS